MKYRLKFRVTEESGEKRKYSINLEDRDRFPLGRDSVGISLQGAPDPAVLCVLFVREGCIWVEDRKCPGGIMVNSRAGREFPLQQGDMLQIGTFSIEFLEAPAPPKAEPRETQFLDLQEFMKTGGGTARSKPAAAAATAPQENPGGGRRHNKKSRRQQQLQLQQQQTQAASHKHKPAPSEQTSELQTPVNLAAATPVAATKTQTNTNTSVQAFSVPAEGANEDNDAGFVPEPQQPHAAAGMNTAPPEQTGQTSMTGFTSFNDAFNNGEPHENKIAEAFPGRDFMPVSRPDSLAGGGSHSSPRRSNHPAESLPSSSSSSSGRRQQQPHQAARQAPSAQTQFTQPSFVPNVEVRSSGPGEQTLLTEKNREIIQTSMGLFILVCSSAAMGSLLARRLGEAMFGANGVQTAIIIYSTIAIALAFLLSWVFHLCHEYMRTPSQFPAFLRFSSWASLLMIPWAYSFSFQPSGIVFVTLLLTIVGMTAFLVRFKPDLPRFFAVSGITFVILAAGSYPIVRETPLYLLHAGPGAQRMVATEDENPPDAAAAAQNPQRAPAGTVAPAPVVQQNPVTAPAPAPAPVPVVVPPPPVTAAPVAQQSPPPTTTAVATTADPSNRILDPLANDQFFTAIRSGNLDAVKDLITKGAIDANFTLYQGNTPLLVAASSGQLEVLKYLVTQRVNLNAQDPNGTTALMWAVYKGNKDMVSFLIQKGANLNIRRDDGDTAYDLAKRWKKTEVAKIFESIYAQRHLASQGSSATSSRSKSKSSRSKSSKSSRRSRDDDDN